ncbi:MAG: hypothetical protein ACREMV_10290, partial [Gemmatimonadales bacterium]
PDVLIVMPCGFGLEASRADALHHAERLYAVASKAIESNRAYVVDASSYFNRSGPRVVDGIEILAALLHPEAFPLVSPPRVVTSVAAMRTPRQSPPEANSGA